MTLYLSLEVTLDVGRALSDAELERLGIERVNLSLALSPMDQRDPSIEVPSSLIALRRFTFDRAMDRTLTVDAILADPTVSKWLKSALQSALVRDPVDAANDASVLAQMLEIRAARSLEGGDHE